MHEVIIPFGNIIKLDAPVKHLKIKSSDRARNLNIYEKILHNGGALDARQIYYYGRELMVNGKYIYRLLYIVYFPFPEKSAPAIFADTLFF